MRRRGRPVDPMTVQGFEYVSPIEALDELLHYEREVKPFIDRLDGRAAVTSTEATTD